MFSHIKIFDMKKTPGGSIYLAGISMYYTETNNPEGIIFKVDSLGNTKWI
jgi:hypothetical protein